MSDHLFVKLFAVSARPACDAEEWCKVDFAIPIAEWLGIGAGS